MIRHIQYSFLNFFKSKSIYALIGIGTTLFILLELLRKYNGGEKFLLNSHFLYIWNLPMYCSIMFLILSSGKTLFISQNYTSVRTLIAIKPITRTKITISKILTILAINLVQIIYWLVLVSLLSIMDNLTIFERNSYVLSVFLGLIMISTFGIALTLLVALLFQGKTLFIIGSLLTLTMPLFTTINNLTIKSHAYFHPTSYYYLLNNDGTKGEEFIVDTRYKHMDGGKHIYPRDSDVIKLFKNYDPLLFQATGVLDIYNQLNNLTLSSVSGLSSEPDQKYWQDIKTINTKNKTNIVKYKNQDYLILFAEPTSIASYKKQYLNNFNKIMNDKTRQQDIIDALSNNDDYKNLTFSARWTFMKEFYTHYNTSKSKTIIIQEALDAAKNGGEATWNRDIIQFANETSYKTMLWLDHTTNPRLKFKQPERDIVKHIWENAMPSALDLRLIVNDKIQVPIFNKTNITSQVWFSISLIFLLLISSGAIILKEHREWIK